MDPRMPEQLDEEELADCRAGRNAVYQLAALTIGTRLDAPGWRAQSEISNPSAASLLTPTSQPS
jgi:hypothetical protein